jgi:hypothetical protein
MALYLIAAPRLILAGSLVLIIRTGVASTLLARRLAHVVLNLRLGLRLISRSDSALQ